MSTKNLKILVVEDDENARKTLVMMLRELEVAQIHECSDGAKALKYLDDKDQDIDMIISDWNMPNKDGFEFLREIRTVSPNTPFIMITARTDKNSIKDAIKSGVTAYLRKPFDLNELREKIVTSAISMTGSNTSM